MDGVSKIKLSDEDRAKHLDWCKQFIEHHCVFRSPPGTRLLISPRGGLISWQFFMQIGLLDQEFAYRIGLLFWDKFIESYEKQPFQLCGCETGGITLLSALQSAAYTAGFEVNVFSVKKEPKAYGLRNWFEGIVLEDLPVMLIDDITASNKTLKDQAKRLLDSGLTLYSDAFSICSCRTPRSITFKVDDKTVDVTVFYWIDDFSMFFGKYAAKYGRPPKFQGITL